MSIPRPYQIYVHNRANDERVGQYVANDPPRVGDLLSLYSGHTEEGDPFHLWGTWRVDTVMWRVSGQGSRNALDIFRETDGRIRDAVCWELDVTVWPEQGVHWAETPKWQRPLQSASYRDDEPLLVEE